MWTLEPSPAGGEATPEPGTPPVRHPPSRTADNPAQVLDRGRQYYASIQSGRRSGAGTDANIYIQLRGTRGTSREFLLDKPGYDDFESGDHDTYYLGEFDIGDLTHVSLRNDGANAGADWFVDWVCLSRDDRMCHSDDRVRIGDWLRGNAATFWLPVP
jgi:hypothetical protein